MIKCVEPTMIRENRVYICICVKKKPKNAYVDIVDEGRERGSPLVLFVRRGAEGQWSFKRHFRAIVCG